LVKSLTDANIQSPQDLQRVDGPGFTLLKQGFERVQSLQRTHADRQRLLLMTALEEGAVIQAFYSILVERTHLMTWSDLATCFQLRDKDYSAKIREVYLLVRKYNMIIYSGCPLRYLMRWNKELTEYLEHRPSEARVFINNSTAQGFTFGTAQYQFSGENRQELARITDEINKRDDE